ncbi:MAG TPA: hypothetical protein VF021_04195 [Longimicrobiales bacterium]
MGFSPQVSASKKPMQVRFFSGANVGDLQKEINAWLAQTPQREIVDVRQSVGQGQGILVSVWYID